MKQRWSENKFAFLFPAGIGIGIGIGALIHNIGVGLAIGAAIGTISNLIGWHFSSEHIDDDQVLRE